MNRRILLIIGHPDADPAHFCRALAARYAAGALAADHSVDEVDLARLDFPLLRSADSFYNTPLPRRSKRRPAR